MALEIVAPEHTFRVQTVGAGDELGWSALLMGRGKHFQARVLDALMHSHSMAASCSQRASTTPTSASSSCTCLMWSQTTAGDLIAAVGRAFACCARAEREHSSIGFSP